MASGLPSYALLRGRHQEDGARPLEDVGEAPLHDQRQRSERVPAPPVASQGGLFSEGKLIHASIVCNFCAATVITLFSCLMLSRWVAFQLYSATPGGGLANGKVSWLNQSLENPPLSYDASLWRERNEEKPGSGPESLGSSEQMRLEQLQKQTQEEEQEQGAQGHSGETPGSEPKAGSDDSKEQEEGASPAAGDEKMDKGRQRGRGRAGRKRKQGKSPPRVAFLFLTRGPLPLRPLWELFFNSSQDTERLSVYVHASIPGYKVDRGLDRGSFFRDRQVEQVKVQWGGFGMVTAEKKLLDAALEEERNQRFVLLSEACIPLRPFDYVYSYLMEEEKSFLASYNSTWRLGGRVIEKYIPREKLMKGSQWFALTRAHAKLAVKEEKLQKAFEKAKAKIPDETYMQTVLPFLDPEGFIPRPVTFVQWYGYHLRQGKTSFTGGALGPGDQAGRPRTFYEEDVSRKALEDIRDRTSTAEERVTMRSFSPSLPCTKASTGEPIPCFLFARKFHMESLPKLLEMRDLFGY